MLKLVQADLLIAGNLSTSLVKLRVKRKIVVPDDLYIQPNGPMKAGSYALLSPGLAT